MSKNTPIPTEAELELLAVLWERGPSTVREIHDVIAGEKDTGYTTTLKILQKMTDKGLVVRDETNRSHVYRAAFKEEKTQRQLVDILLQSAFGGAVDKLVMRALSNRKVHAAEIARLRKLLDDLEDKSP
jgi:predicted transcriptional regulator